MNAATRLKLLLDSIQSVTADNVRQGWAKVFDLETTDTADVLRALAGALALIREAENEIRSLKGGHSVDLHMAALNDIKQALEPVHLEGSWRDLQNRFTSGTVRSFALTVDTVRVARPTTSIPPEGVQTLLRDLNVLIEQVSGSDFDQTLKIAVLHHLEYARRALLEYRVRGVEGIQEAFDLNLGFAIRTATKDEDEEEAKYGSNELSALRKFWNFLGDLNTTLSLAGYGWKYLPPTVEAAKGLLAAHGT